jgi:hypothetical protein
VPDDVDNDFLLVYLQLTSANRLFQYEGEFVKGAKEVTMI